MTDLKTKLLEADGVCCIEGCDKPVKHKAMCSMHYTRDWRNGSPHITQRTPRKTIVEWIEANLKPETDDCVFWPFARDGAGYGSTRLNGKKTPAHRAMLKLSDPDGEFEGALALHTCGNGHNACVNTRHLYWGTPKQNMDDRHSDGTAPIGSKCYSAKLTERDIVPIFKIRIEGKKPSEIGDLFGVTKGAINQVLRRKTWRHVEVPLALLSALDEGAE